MPVIAIPNLSTHIAVSVPVQPRPPHPRCDRTGHDHH